LEDILEIYGDVKKLIKTASIILKWFSYLSK
jgi:hypothetical protein